MILLLALTSKKNKNSLWNPQIKWPNEPNARFADADDQFATIKRDQAVLPLLWMYSKKKI